MRSLAKNWRDGSHGIAYLFIRTLRRLEVIDFDEAQEMRYLIHKINRGKV